MRAIVAAAAAAAAVHAAIVNTSGAHLFVDGDGIAEASGLVFEQAVPAKNTDAPLVYPQYPWETAVHFYTSLVTVPPDVNGLAAPSFQLYYVCAHQLLFNFSIQVCVANSTDGITWEKPMLPYYPFTFENGSTTNTNIVFNTMVNEFMGSVFLDTTAGVPASERFKMAFENVTDRQVYVATSPDGFAWTPVGQPAIIVPGFADTQVAMAPDAFSGGYTCFGRKDATVVNTSTASCPGGYPSERHVMLSHTDGSTVFDPAAWSEPVEVLQLGYPDPFNCFDNYNPAWLQFGDAGLLFPSEFIHIPIAASGSPIPRSAGNDGVMDIRMLVSRDNRNFSWVSRDAFIPRGVGRRDPASALYNATGSDRDAGFVFATVNGLLDRGDPNSVYMLYWGSQTTHAGGGAFLYTQWPQAYSGIFAAKLRREGFVALRTPQGSDTVGSGYFVTDPFTVPTVDAVCPGAPAGTGLALALNVHASVSGSFAASILSPAAGYKPIPGYAAEDATPQWGNFIRQPLQWTIGSGGFGNVTADIAPLAGQVVALNVTLTRAQLYAWELQCL